MMTLFRNLFNFTGPVAYAMFLLCIFGFTAFRAYGVWSVVSRHTGRDEPVFINIITNDAVVLSLIFFLLYIGFFTRIDRWRKIKAYLAKTVAILLTLYYAADSVLLVTLMRRLHYRDLLKYGTELQAALPFLTSIKTIFFDLLSVEVIGALFAAGFIFLSVSFYRLRFNRRWKNLHSRALLTTGICFACISLIPVDRIVLYGWAYENIFTYNMPKGIDQPYSTEFTGTLNGGVREKEIDIVRGAGKHPDILLVVIESLSSSHSRFFSGINNYTPHLDAIAKENFSFTNFFANGFSTEQGLIALFLGETPLPSVNAGGRGAFRGYYRDTSVPALLTSAGYDTFFITTGDISFTNKGEWLKRIGFSEVYGSELPAFRDRPKFAFNAAPDKDLYAFALEKIKRLRENRHPWFMAIETVSSHLPFIDPEGRSNTEAAIMGYVDRQLGLFYEKLKGTGFFNDGLLIITSDHRVMAPLSKTELDRFGKSAFARIPLVVAFKDRQRGKSEEYFQQTDLYESLKWLISQEYQKSRWSGNFLHPEPTPPFCILKHMANDYDLVYIRCGSDDGYIKLQGDRTRLIQGRISPEKAAAMIRKINRDRISLDTSN